MTRGIPMHRRCSPVTPTPRAKARSRLGNWWSSSTWRLNPDRVVVGELVEDEALDMLDVASMCKRGSLATIHADTADIVLQRLAYYVSKSNTSLPEFAVNSLIAQTVDFVVHIDLVRNAVEEQAAVRRVTSIIEVGGLAKREACRAPRCGPSTTLMNSCRSHHCRNGT